MRAIFSWPEKFLKYFSANIIWKYENKNKIPHKTSHTQKNHQLCKIVGLFLSYVFIILLFSYFAYFPKVLHNSESCFHLYHILCYKIYPINVWIIYEPMHVSNFINHSPRGRYLNLFPHSCSWKYWEISIFM